MSRPSVLQGFYIKFKSIFKKYFPLFLGGVSIFFLLLSLFLFSNTAQKDKALIRLEKQNTGSQQQLLTATKDLQTLKSTDQVKRNDDLEKTIKAIQSSYTDAISVYEKMTDLPASNKELPDYQKRFAQILKYLSEKNYSSGSAQVIALSKDIDKAKATALAAAGGIDTSKVPVNNAPPGSGFSRQQVDVNGASYLVDLIAGNLSSTKVVVDTASDNDCGNDCPTLPLATYISRNGAYAGINGSYFCPAEYPSCAGKTNSYDTLLMNVKKHYFNSDNNIYSTVPAVIFGGSWVRFVGKSQDWGRDTGVDGVLANQPLLVSGGNVAFGGDGDPKKGSRGNRSFVSNRGNTVYIGVVHNVTVAESALVMKALGMENALNLDSGGSTALWSGGYKDGPGRNIPNAILFVNR
jgi:hypothetical protein